MIDTIRDTLNNQSGLSAWQIRSVINRSNQIYIIDHDTESMRTVDTKKYVITVFVERDAGGRKVMGESEFLFVHGEDLKAKLDAAVSMAALVDNEPFILPGPGQSYEFIETVDIEIKNNPDKIITRIRDDIFKAVDRENGIRLSAAEIYVNLFYIEILNSSGLKAARENTEIYVEFVLMAGNKGYEEAESGTAKRDRFYSNLKISDVIKEYAGYALDSLSAELPPTGRFDVIFSGEALDTLFNWFTVQSSGAAKYERWSLFEEGNPVIENSEGENLTLISNPYLSGGMMTRSFDNQGLSLKCAHVIKNGIFKTRMTSKRYSDYLHIPAVGEFANVEVAPGNMSRDELFNNRPVLHLCRFSTFEPNGVTGSFSGEIRSGWLVDDKGQIKPVKGGAVTGTMQEAFKKVYFSKEVVQRESYMGPAYIKICGLCIGGE